MAKPIVALVGRPNVGKSTLFNRIVGARVAIVEDVAGTTRDRLYYDAEWSGHEFTVVDTGGLEITPGSDIARRVREQAELAIREADVVVFLLDVRDGLTPDDQSIAQALRQAAKLVVITANKADNPTFRQNAVEFYRLGLGEVWPISALHGTGTGDLLDAVVAVLPELPPEREVDQLFRVAIVGRPNVGKSSLLNAILGRDRVIVAEQPGTTRDSIDTTIAVDGEQLVLVDTAGVRRRGRIAQGVEYYSVLRTLRAITSCDVALLLIDATEGVTAQDAHLAGYVRDAYKGLVIVVNKWDLIPKVENPLEEFTRHVRAELQFVPWAPVVFISAKTGLRVNETLALALRARDERMKRVPTAGLNELVTEAVMTHAPSSVRGRQAKVFYVTQAAVNPPTLIFFVNDPTLLHFSYQRFLENRLREAFGFEGTPLKLVFRARAKA
ncbi:MAG: ribosome biogenesis GTPase Der [Chloroflexi bacterium]|nr:ribosome biogenesis GTPase Der [Chloroflexota bacterium]